MFIRYICCHELSYVISHFHETQYKLFSEVFNVISSHFRKNECHFLETLLLIRHYIIVFVSFITYLFIYDRMKAVHKLPVSLKQVATINNSDFQHY